jgi:hypothetical protein
VLNEYEALECILREFDGELLGFFERAPLPRVKASIPPSLSSLGRYYESIAGALPMKTRCSLYYQDCKHYDQLRPSRCRKEPIGQLDCWEPRPNEKAEQLDLFEQKDAAQEAEAEPEQKRPLPNAPQSL